uniref:RING-type domain-containing protein n=1 Tax=viral metagenome TaxID=1070528 RepID=A0A6C0JXU1_9ZZZZ
MSNRSNNRNNRNAENILFDYLLNTLDRSYQDVPRTNTNTLTETNINLLLRVFDSYQRNVEIYNNNMRELIQLLRTTMDTYRQPTAPTPAPAPTTNTRESRYNRPWYFASTTPRPVDSSNNATPRDMRQGAANARTSARTTTASTSTPSNTQRLNTSEIDRNVSIVTYSSSETETRCPISLEDFYVGESICKINNCGHFFKRDALYRWFNSHTTCPVCRSNVLPTPRNIVNNTYNSPITENNIINDYTRSFAYTLLSSLNTNPSNIQTYIFDIPIYYDLSGNARENQSSQNTTTPQGINTTNEENRQNVNDSESDYLSEYD